MIRLSILTLFLFFYSHIAHPQTSPASGLLVTTDGRQDSVVIINLSTGEQTRFSVADGLHTAWGFSPDGCRVLVTVMGGNGLARGFTVNLDGSDRRSLVTLADFPDNQWGVWEPTWSPTGDKIAFKLIRDGFEGNPERAYHIAWITPDGGEPSFYSVTGREHTPIWSPDGSQLAYVSYDKRAPGAHFDATAEPDIATATPPENLLNEADMWVVNADGTGKFRATAFETGSVRAPRWSPDGKWLSFVMSPSPSNDTLWFIAPISGAKPVQITYRYQLTLDHTWLLDSSAMLVAARSVNGDESAALWLFSPQAGSDDSATRYLPDTDLPYPDYPSFSPDGTSLVLRSGYRASLITHNNNITFLTNLDGNMPIYWSSAPLINTENCLSP